MTNWEVLRIGSATQLDYPITDVPTPESVSITKAYWMLKAFLDDADNAALVTLTITASPTAQGQIADSGTGDGVGLLKFLLGESAILSLDPARCITAQSR